jgi:F-type H+-transporting ATPase subunit b
MMNMARFGVNLNKLAMAALVREGRFAAAASNGHRIALFSSAPPAAPTPAAPEEEQKYPVDDLPEGLVMVPPRLPKIKTVIVDNIEECRPSRSIADQLSVNFGPNMPTVDDDKKPERDLVNFPRTERPENPEPARLVIIPQSWFNMFYEKTGVTGPYVFFGGLSTFLLSKELLIIEHEMVVGFTLAVIFAYAIKKLKDPAIAYFNKIDDATVDSWNQYQHGSVKVLQDYVEMEKAGQKSLEGQKILFDAKRENVHLQREAEYRRRIQQVHDEVKRKLEYQIATQNSAKQFSQKHMVNWIISSVSKGITPQQEKDALSKCITDLKQLSSKRAGAI